MTDVPSLYVYDKRETSREREVVIKTGAEGYSRYRILWKSLFLEDAEKIRRRFKLEFKKKYVQEDFLHEFYTDDFPLSLSNSLELLKSLGWRKKPYEKQHWGNWLHSLSPYQGRITPSFAHWLLKIFTKRGDVVLDPFCGVGTIPLEADLLERRAIGVDLNAYAAIISRAKAERKPLNNHVNYLKSLVDFDSSQVSLDLVDSWVRDYFDDNTLREIIWLKENFEENKQSFLLACLMGILHGNRPGYLSVYTGCIIPMVPRKEDHPKYRPDRDRKVYRAVLPRLLAKIYRMYQSGIPLDSQIDIHNADSRALPLDENSVDIVISSPPYYNTLDYVTVNRVRLYILGINKEKQDTLKKELIQDSKSYQEEMLKIGMELKRVLKPNKLLVFILGDVHRSKYSINTAKDISKLYEKYLGFRQICIVNDEIPKNKTASRTKRSKLDRILVLQNIDESVLEYVSGDNSIFGEMTTYTDQSDTTDEMLDEKELASQPTPFGLES